MLGTPLRLNALLRLLDERSEIASAHIGRDHDASLAIFATDLVRADDELDRGDLLEGNESAHAIGSAGRRNPQATDLVEADYLKGDGVVREAHSFDVAVKAAANGKTHA